MKETYESNIWTLSADHKDVVFEHEDYGAGCRHELKVQTILRALKPAIKPDTALLADIKGAIEAIRNVSNSFYADGTREKDITRLMLWESKLRKHVGME